MFGELPGSDRGATALVALAVSAAVAAAARITYGKDPLTARALFGGMLASISAGLMVYSIMASTGHVSGWLTVGIGCAAGTFTEHFLRLAHIKFVGKQDMPES